MTLLDDLAGSCGPERPVSVGRELTKIHEEFVRGTLAEVAAYYRERPPRGEVTLVVGPAAETGDPEAMHGRAADLANELLKDGMKPSAAAREVARRLGLARNEAYRIVHDSAGVQGASGPTATTGE